MTWISGRQNTGYQRKTLFESVLFRCDCHILRYKKHSYIPPHIDPAPPGFKHYRLNVVIKSCKLGGELKLDHQPQFQLGPIVVFRPDINVHSVSEVYEGTRYVFSIGWLCKEK